jgi:predicted alpha/beta superfamily hydrolase
MKTDYPPATIVGTHTRTLYSKLVDDEYELSIYLPPGYDDSEKVYPVLYLLDAPTLFGSAVAAVLHQNWDSVAEIPEMIVVGIGKRLDRLDDWWPIRERDYIPTHIPSMPNTGHASAFLDFFDQELIPFIDRNYRTQQNDRIIWGCSFGGIFVLYAMFNKTTLFKRYISICPAFTWGKETTFDYEMALHGASLSSEALLFVCVGSQDHLCRSDVEAFTKTLSTRTIPNLKYQSLVLDGLGHAPACVPAFYHGIEAVYTM